MPKTCPRCFKTDEADIDTCLDKAVLGCPAPVNLTPELAVEVKCGPCKKHMLIPVGNVMQRRHLNNLGTCVSDRCRAKIVLPKAATPAKPSPPPITEAKPPVVEASGGPGK